MTTATEKTAKFDIYQDVTDRIIAALESGPGVWQKAWQGGGSVKNAVTGDPYSGTNILLLRLAATDALYEHNRWLTFKQAKSVGATVRKGEHGESIVFCKEYNRKRDATPLDDPAKVIVVKGVKKVLEKAFTLRYYTVFNIAQVDDLPEEYTPEPFEVRDDVTTYDNVEAFVAKSGTTIETGGSSAAYFSSTDRIVIPERGRFDNDDAYYATLLHELTHSTGHRSRCNRMLGNAFGSPEYAFEELIAELGSAFLCAQFNIDVGLRHPAYLQSWLKVLRDDKKAIFRAVSKAREAVDYLNVRNEATETTMAA